MKSASWLFCRALKAGPVSAREKFSMSSRVMQSAIAALALVTALGWPIAASAQSEKTWESLRADIIMDKEPRDGAAFLEISAPDRAEDAAIVPLSLRQKEGSALPGPVKWVTFVVDENPSPVVATFTFGPRAAGLALETRVRVNSYSWVRALAEMEDGSLYMVKRFVKASGGCSAPALKDDRQAKAEMGEMRVRSVPAGPGESHAAQLMIRHPNYSGLQMNQLTRLYIPAHFIRDVEVTQNGKLIWKMEGGISISENPNFIFPLNSREPGPAVIAVRATDTDDKVFEGTFTLDMTKG
jgi:sulfur-oxidizing protein SoxY